MIPSMFTGFLQVRVGDIRFLGTCLLESYRGWMYNATIMQREGCAWKRFV